MRRLALGLATLAVAACGRPDAPDDVRSDTGAAAVAAVPGDDDARLVSAAWLAGALEDSAVIVIHVDDADAYRSGHVRGARFLPLDAIAVTREGLPRQVPDTEHLDSVYARLGVKADSRVVLYGPPLAAARAFVTLDVVGLDDRAALLDGGLAEWRAANGPLSDAPADPSHVRPTGTEAEPVPAPEDRARPSDRRADVIVDADWVAANRTRDDVVLLDARPPRQYTGEEPGEGVARGGHIPGAANLYWERTVRSADQPLLLDADALRDMFRAAGVEPGDTVVVYCRTGMQSSFLYFVARYLGYETRMYDGSYMDWSRRAELPVETGTGGAPIG
jgi:thiosulfate/3-mercaptopyruvate sulfurtransferase